MIILAAFSDKSLVSLGIKALVQRNDHEGSPLLQREHAYIIMHCGTGGYSGVGRNRDKVEVALLILSEGHENTFRGSYT